MLLRMSKRSLRLEMSQGTALFKSSEERATRVFSLHGHFKAPKTMSNRQLQKV